MAYQPVLYVSGVGRILQNANIIDGFMANWIWAVD